jgi:pyridoxamine 5'-phosphate oxidase
MDLVDLARLRRDYEAAGLDEDDLPADPMVLFHRWLADAAAAGIAEVNAMVVATVGADGRPSSRMVLCKAADARGFVFFTNYDSRKGAEVAATRDVALLFPWHPLARQVRVEGRAAPVDRQESEEYFASRPRGAQLSAWASPQSSAVPSRAALEDRVAVVAREYDGRPVPCPPFWGGIRVVASRLEFWQGRRDRLHDRLRYRRNAHGGWELERLFP